MGLTAGIVGLPNVGKSTIFNALTSGSAAMENYPFCTVDPNYGITAIPDHRLEIVANHITTGKIIPAFLELVDIAGLVKGASHGEGLGNQFLGYIKEVDAIVLICRCFNDADIIHVDGSISALRDMAVIETELLLKDLDTIDKALIRTEKAYRTGNKELKETVAVLEKLKNDCSQSIPARLSVDDCNQKKRIHDLHLITMKPILYVANCSDEGISVEEQKQINSVKEHAINLNCQAICLSGKIESEIMQLPINERADYYESLGIMESGLSRLSRSLYTLLNFISFFTINEKELHAWPIENGTTAVEAAASVHSDFSDNFIKADVYNSEALAQFGSEPALRAAGKIRSEGRDYVVKDGDVLFFKATPT